METPKSLRECLNCWKSKKCFTELIYYDLQFYCRKVLELFLLYSVIKKEYKGNDKDLFLLLNEAAKAYNEGDEELRELIKKYYRVVIQDEM